VQHLLAEHPTIVRSLYAGDDQTDLDAFGVVDVAIAVASDEAPAELGVAAVLTVDGPAGLATLLESLANSE
jgi:trehalose-6-phosphatase